MRMISGVVESNVSTLTVLSRNEWAESLGCSGNSIK